MKLLKFYASWCAPCQAMNPVVYSVTKEKNVQCDNIDIDLPDSDDLTRKHGVRSIPTLVLVDDSGAAIKTHVGKMTKSELEEFLTV